MMVLLSAMLIISCDDSKDDLGKKDTKPAIQAPAEESFSTSTRTQKPINGHILRSVKATYPRRISINLSGGRLLRNAERERK